ncbi:MFS antiporter QDR2 [Cytospora mali]|uniref:MFS antiporter QDR2 n=1 Tax=Cytospora mali TaxID=578113 RepID=A0A194W4Z8_CYTMA|nr:MFS antiporter QDR2 [Valsa mali]
MGLHYAVYSSLTATLSTLFIDIYNLSEWQADSSTFPSPSLSASTFFSGSLLDGAYRKARTKRGLSTDRIKGDELDNFPIEKARLVVMWIPMVVIVLCTVAYGWVLQYKLSFNTLLLDINHRSPLAASSSTGVVRYAFSAIIVAFIEDMFQSLGVGWSFTLITGFIVIGLGFLAIEYVQGTSWRQEAASQKTSDN